MADAQDDDLVDRHRSTSHPRRKRIPRSPDHYIRLEAQLAAEEERRLHMTPEEKIVENASQLQDLLKREPTSMFLLQPTPPRHMARARCCANYCIFRRQQDRPAVHIKDDHRIVLVAGASEYFHIQCLEKLLHLPSLAPTRFKLDTQVYRWNDSMPWTWGLILRKWFQQSGCVDVNKLVEYIRAHRRHEREDGEFSTRWLDWHFTHEQNCTKGEESCGCPPRPVPPEEPILRDYETNKDDTCLLSTVIAHRYRNKLAPAIHVGGILRPDFSLIAPEREDGI